MYILAQVRTTAVRRDRAPAVRPEREPKQHIRSDPSTGLSTRRWCARAAGRPRRSAPPWTRASRRRGAAPRPARRTSSTRCWATCCAPWARCPTRRPRRRSRPPTAPPTYRTTRAPTPRPSRTARPDCDPACCARPTASPAPSWCAARSGTATTGPSRMTTTSAQSPPNHPRRAPRSPRAPCASSPTRTSPLPLPRRHLHPSLRHPCETEGKSLPTYNED